MKSKLVPLGLALTLASVARADFAPIALTSDSYNADVVVEKTVPALGNNTSATPDGGTNNSNNAFYEIGYNTNNPTSGLLPAGTTFVSASFTNHSYTMGPSYTAKNAWLIDTGVTNATITLVTPAAYTNLSFLISSGNGGGTVAYTIHHADATTESGTFICSDWFGGANPAFIALGRLNVTSGVLDTQASITSPPGNPRLYGRDVTVVNTGSAITTIDLFYSSGAANVHNQIYALSGATAAGTSWAPIAVTGQSYDMIVEAGGVKRGPTAATTQSMDNNVNTVNAWYEKGYHKFPLYANTGLPLAGSTITNASALDHAYKFAPDYTVNNVSYLNPSNTPVNFTIVTQTLVTPTAYSALSFLNSSGNGPRNIDVLINHADGSSEAHTFVSFDWFGTAASVLGTSGRVEVDTKQFNNLTATPGSNPKLFAAEFILNNTVSPITNIVLSSTNLIGRTAIFAVSGTAGAAAPIFSLQPQPLILSPGLTANFTASVSGTAPLTVQWQKGTNGIYVNVVNGGTISGAATTNLTITGVVAGDDADYRLLASNVAASVPSSAAHLTVLSPLSDVTVPSDPVTAVGANFPVNEAPLHVIDNDISKYLNFGGNNGAPFLGPVGLAVTPSMGATFVTGLRLYTANDSVGRDPVDYELYGSSDGGANYTLISSNLLALPDGRNASPAALDPTTQVLQQVLFANTNGYATYKLTFTRVKDATGANSMQIGEVEFLGVADTNGRPSVVLVSSSVRAYAGTAASVSAIVNGTPAPAVHWQKGTNGVYANLGDTGNISGSQTANLSISPAALGSDTADYRIIAVNTSGSVTSAVARVTILSTLADVTSPSDIVAPYHDDGLGSLNAPSTDPSLAINDSLNPYVNSGTGPSAAAGFAPFVGPAGFDVTPASGASLVTGVRFYTSSGAVVDDPADYRLEGSNNGGGSFALISAGALSLPVDRNAAATPMDPLVVPMQEVLFANSQGYSTYRVTFTNAKDNSTANSVRIAELELLGINVPILTVSIDAGGGTLSLTTTMSGTLQSTTDLSPTNPVWVNEGPISGTITVTPSPAVAKKFYRVSVP